MKASNKKLLGCLGLALVAGLTTAAATVPVGATSAGAAVHISVEVYRMNFETKIMTPEDGAEFTDPEVEFSEIHSHANSVKYYLENVTTGQTYELTDYEVSGSDVDGTTTFTLDLNNYGGFGTYIFRTKIIGSESGAEGEDSTQFVYKDASSPDEPEIPETGGGGSPSTPNTGNLGAFYNTLGVSNADLLTTVLIGFTLVSLASLFVIKKSSHKE